MRGEWNERSGTSYGGDRQGRREQGPERPYRTGIRTPGPQWHAADVERRPLRARRRRGGQRGTSVVRGQKSHGQAAVHRWPRALDGGEPDERRSTLSRWERMRERARNADTSRQREFLTKYRAPIIGLSVAGAAIPMAGGTSATEEDAERAAEAAAAAGEQPAATDEALGQQWRAAEEAAAGVEADAAIIDRAVQRYDIPRDLAQDIVAAAKKNDIDPQLALGLVKTESMFDERAVSHVGARGLTQVMPATAQGLRPGTSADQLFNRKFNLDLGFSYLRDLIDKYNGDERMALLAYNRGPGTVDKVLKQGGDPDNGYAAKVMRG